MASIFCVMLCEAKGNKQRHKRFLAVAPSPEHAAMLASGSTGWPPSKFYAFEVGSLNGDMVELWGGNTIPFNPVIALH